MARRLLVAVTCLVVAASLAGCVGSGEPSDLPVDSFDEAMDAPGEVVEPVDSDSSVRLKLLDPADPSSVPKTKTDVVLLLYDDGPITDAEMTLEARMPAMGHGTSPEQDPMHRKEGIYVGRTNFAMAGDWVLEVGASLADGTSLDFEIDVTAGEDGGGGDGDAATFSSFDEAMEADGETYQPDEGWLIDETSGSGSFDAAVPLEPARSWSMPFEVAEAEGAEVTVNASMDPGSDADELTFSIRDPAGDEAESFTLTAGDEESRILTFEPSDAGTWSVNVTGQGADVSFAVEVLAKAPVGEDVRLKTLDPATPDDAEQGAQPFVVLLYDSEAGEPITNASMTLASYMPTMGHGTSGEEDPAHQGDGIYEGQTNLAMGGEWRVNVTAELADGAQLSWSIPATA